MPPFNTVYLQAVIFCDIVILYCSKRRKFYSDNKYLRVQDEDAIFVSSDNKI